MESALDEFTVKSGVAPNFLLGNIDALISMQSKVRRHQIKWSNFNLQLAKADMPCQKWKGTSMDSGRIIGNACDLTFWSDTTLNK